MESKVEKEVYWISEFSEAYGPSRSKVYEEINRGRLRVFKIGRRTAITKAAAIEWVKLCESESKAG